MPENSSRSFHPGLEKKQFLCLLDKYLSIEADQEGWEKFKFAIIFQHVIEWRLGELTIINM